MGAIGRWGDSFDLDFWTAVACGEVDGPEMRAVDLLRHTTDEERFGYYCQTGMLPAMGNVTGRIYLLQRGGQAMELEDGRPVASWCISIGPHATDIPGTDQVVVLRNMVEGEELDFLEIGNRSPIWHQYEPDLLFGMQRILEWLPHACLESFGCDMGEAENEELLELAEIRNEDWVPEAGVQPLQVPPYEGFLEPPVEANWGPQRHGPVELAVQQQLQNYFDEQNDPAEEYTLDEAIEEMIDVHGPEIGEEIAAAVQQNEGYADIHYFQEGALYEPDGPVLRQIPGQRMEAFLPVPAGPRIPVVGMMA